MFTQAIPHFQFLILLYIWAEPPCRASLLLGEPPPRGLMYEYAKNDTIVHLWSSIRRMLGGVMTSIRRMLCDVNVYVRLRFPVRVRMFIVYV